MNTTRNFIRTTLILALVAAYPQLIFGTANKALPKALIIGDSISIGSRNSYDEWCLSQLAKNLGDKDGYRFYLKQAYNYRNVFNPATRFFHPKDKDGNFIEPFDYRFSGGRGAREYYGENNVWIYRGDVQHNIADLVKLIGGEKAFCKALDSMFAEPMGRGKSGFYELLTDKTGNEGQFSMAKTVFL